MCAGRQAFLDVIVRNGRFPFCVNSHPSRSEGSQRLIDLAIFGHLSLDEYEVCFFNLSLFKLEAQESVGGGIFGKEDYSACSAIQPMNNKYFFIEVCFQLFV